MKSVKSIKDSKLSSKILNVNSHKDIFHLSYLRVPIHLNWKGIFHFSYFVEDGGLPDKDFLIEPASRQLLDVTSMSIR